MEQDTDLDTQESEAEICASNLIPSEPIDDIQDFHARIRLIMEEAHEMGFVGIFAISGYDRLKRKDVYVYDGVGSIIYQIGVAKVLYDNTLCQADDNIDDGPPDEREMA